jgi:hypothetical protein
MMYINGLAFGATVQAGLFKIIQEEGVSVLQYCLSRNLFLLALTLIFLAQNGRKPWQELPRNLYFPVLFFRCLTG